MGASISAILSACGFSFASTSTAGTPTTDHSAVASASTAVNPPTNSCYHIFLNHRGEDTKKTFASHLYRRLVLHGFRVFWDKEEMHVGDTLTSQIPAAINTASVHVAIFSPKYAGSYWCLEELQLMVESGKTIIPVFYNVQPTELRRTHGDGVYARALGILEGKKGSDGQPRYNSTTVQNWRAALSKVADISGLELERFNGDEGELLDKVVESVLETLNKTLKLNKRFDVAEHPTGLDEIITGFENTVLMQQQSGKPKVIGIVGLGGIGKTTLVQELFNRKNSDYSRSCFLCEVRENARKHSLEYLQMELLKDLTQLDQQIKSVSEGKQMLRNFVKSNCNCKALVILDDVDHKDQLDALLLPIRDVLQSDSLVLITSRDRDVLRKSKVEESSIYKLTGLNPQQSKELFCLHAFTQRHPHPGFEDLVEKYLNACGGLPLSLKVFGGLLYGNDDDKSFWEDHLERLEQILPDDIQKRLQISYDALQRDEKHMFLDIACFFIGKKKDTVIRIWDGSHWKGSLGFRSLQNKNLVDVVGTENEIRMHEHLRDLGRDLAKNPDLPLRIWRREDMDDLLHQSSEATEVRGIRTGLTEYADLYYLGGKMKKLQLLVIEDFNHLGDFNIDIESILDAVQSPNLIWLRWNTGGHSSLPWTLMRKLRVLQVSGERLKTLWRKVSQAPLELRELRIHANMLTSLPESFGNLIKLQHLDLSGNISLKRLPDSFRKLINLKHINLSECYDLKRLPDSFGKLINLQHIELSWCFALKRLPDSFGNLIQLQHLDLSSCRSLQWLPECFGEVINLQHINLSSCDALKGLPDSFGELINLQHINLSWCSALKRLPHSFGNLIKLQHLDLSSSRSLEWLPDSFGNLTNLQHLDLSSSTSLWWLSDSFEKLINLQHINLSSCPYLKGLPDFFGRLINLQHINLSGCRSLEWLSDSFGNLRRLKYLDLTWCYKLTMSNDTLGNISTLEYLSLCCFHGMEVLPSQLANQRSLEILKVSGGSLTDLPSDIGELRNLKKLELLFCNKLKCLPDSLVLLNQLHELRISYCDGLEEVGTLPDALIELGVVDCNKLRKIEGLCSLAKLRRLSIIGCHELEEVPSIERLVSLEYLEVKECGKVRSIRGLARLTKLRRINLFKCSELKELVGVEHLTSLEELNVRECPNLQLPEGVDPRCIQDPDEDDYDCTYDYDYDYTYDYDY